MRIHHIATAEDWRAARRSGSYTTSTRGRTLAEEGFVHAARPEQVRGVWQRYYADLARSGEALLLLTIDTDRLEAAGVAWREEPVGPEGAETFPHVYGAIPTSSVLSTQPMGRDGGTASLTRLFVEEIAWRVAVALGAMVAALAGGLLRGLGGALAGLALGAMVFAVVARRRSRPGPRGRS